MRLERRLVPVLRRIDRRLPNAVRQGVRSTLRPGRSADRGPLVTVVVTVEATAAAHVDEGLHAVRAQTHHHLEVLVIAAGEPGAAEEIVRRHARDDVRLRLRGSAPDRAAARNRGAATARGEYLLFVDASDVLPPHAVEALVAPLEVSGSDLAIGRRTEVYGLVRSVVQPPDPLHDEPRTGQTLDSCPVAVIDLGAENRLYRRSYWQSAALSFRPDDRADAELALHATARASGFDVVEAVTYIGMNRTSSRPVGQLRDHMQGLDAWLADQQDKRATIDSLGVAALRDQWAFAALDTWVQPLLDDAERASPDQWERLRGYVRELTEGMSDEVWQWVRAEPRVKLWLLLHDRRDQLADFMAERWFEQGNRPTRVVDGAVHAELPYYEDERVGIPTEAFVMQPAETPLTVVVREVTWVSRTRLDVVLFVWIDFVGHDDAAPEIEVALVHQGTGKRIDLPVTRHETAQVTHVAGHRYQDYRKGGVTVSVDTEAVAEASVGADDHAWCFEARTAYAGVERSGTLTRRDDRGTAGLLVSRFLAPRRVGNVRVGVASDQGVPLKLTVAPAPPLRLERATISGRSISGVLTGDVEPVEVRITGPQQRSVTAPVRRSDAGARFDVELPDLPGAELAQAWHLHAVDPSGARHPVLWPDDVPEQWLCRGQGRIVLGRSFAGYVEVVEALGILLLEDIRLAPGQLDVTAHWLGRGPVDPSDFRLELTTARTRLLAEPACEGTPEPDGEHRLRIPLTWDEWGLGTAPVPPERYAFGLTHGPEGAPGRVMYGASLLVDTLRFQRDEDYLMRPFRGRDELGVVLARPLGEDERGPYHQKQLQRWCLSGEVPLDPDAVYLQSYAGASATDSQLAIHHELRRSHPHLKLYWGVADRASTVPEGGVPVLMNSRAWFRALAESAYLVNNIDFDRWFVKRPGQRMLQTFHGYPSKSMGIRLWQAKQFSPRRIEAELARTSAGWDVALTPTPEMDEHYRREYRYDGEIFSHGYPRDDVLVSPDADRIRHETRERLGIRPGQTAVLYAPTWRDDLATNYRSAQMAKHLDVESASRALGDDYVMLMRGHRFHARAGHHEGRSTRMVDVTTYPEINDLILAADAAVLDYSSLRFDFALTGRPMLFLVPDLASYTGAVRGFLFDFAASAPGPLLNRADEVVDALRDLERVSARYAGARDAFHAQFNYLQDGHSAEQVVAKFFGPAR